jgi:SprT protein
MSDPGCRPCLELLFHGLNLLHFEGLLAGPRLAWNSRLRRSAGRFVPGSRRWRSRPLIEVATYLLEEEEALRHVRETMAHEMIHQWLWERGRPYGHTDEFHRKLREIGVPRYNPVPRLRPLRWVYRCIECGNESYARKRLTGRLACLPCCRRHNGGRFHARFECRLARELSPREALELAQERRLAVPRAENQE